MRCAPISLWFASALLAAAALAGCYDTPTPACAFHCGAASACPDGYSCAPDNWCKRRDLSPEYVCDQMTADAASNLDGELDFDASDIDANPNAPDGAADAPVSPIDGPEPPDAPGPPDAAPPPDAAVSFDAPPPPPDAPPPPPDAALSFDAPPPPPDAALPDAAPTPPDAAAPADAADTNAA